MTLSTLTCTRGGCGEPRGANGFVCDTHAASVMTQSNGTSPRTPPTVDYYLTSKRNQREADRILAEEEAGEIILPALISLVELLDMPEVVAKYRIEGVLVMGAKIILAAQKKTGKTTMTINLVRSLVDGTPFLGHFNVTPLEEGESLVIFDTEMPTMQLREWLKDAGIKNTHKVHAIPLRGQTQAFRVATPKIRKHWADQLKAVNAKIVIVDPLGPVLNAHEADENSNTDVSRVLVALDALMLEADLSNLIITHHMGHNGERSRGASKLGDWPDAEWWMLWGDRPEGGRGVFFKAYGRDVNQGEALLDYDQGTRRLTIVGDGNPFSNGTVSRAGVKDKLHGDAIMTAVTDKPGILTTELKTATGLSGENFTKVTKSMITVGRIYTVDGKGMSKHWFAGPKPADDAAGDMSE